MLYAFEINGDQKKFFQVSDNPPFSPTSPYFFYVQIVDTPGLLDQDWESNPEKKETKLKETLKCVIYTLPGPHVFYLVIRYVESIKYV